MDEIIAVHLNQPAAFGSVISSAEGLAIQMSVKAAALFEEVLRAFWLPFQLAQPRAGQVPSNQEYGQALVQALQAAGCKPNESAAIGELAKRERERHGLSEAAPVPVVPELDT